ncbi:MAG: LysE family translocator, partial [Proteobacteria bacterium]|nr:LysE family translocator [Pseudomonadota bacterium]
DHSLGKGVLTNFLNPHPYLFWLTVGAPLLFSAHEAAGVLGPILFLAAFYVVLVGAKLGVALLTARSRSFLTSRVYVWLLRGLGLLLVLFAFRFLHEGWVLLAG